MDHRLTTLTWIVIAVFKASMTLHAQSPPSVSLTPIPVEPESEFVSGHEVMHQVVEQISRHQTVSAKVRHRSQLFGQTLIGSGIYLQSQQADRLQARFSLSVKAADRMVSLLHVCDGRTLWMFDNLSGRDQLSRVDLPRLRQAATRQGGQMMPIMLGGGLPQLLGSLDENFIAAAPQSVRFQDLAVWAIPLRWNPQQLKSYLGNENLLDDDGRLRTSQLPEQCPDRVFLYVGQDDLFPYHLDFRRSTSDADLPSAELSRKSGSRSLTTMELFEVQFNAPLNPMLFVYKPGNVEIHDQTDDYLAQLRRRTLQD